MKNEEVCERVRHEKCTEYTGHASVRQHTTKYV